jgi:hypothetical protein
MSSYTVKVGIPAPWKSLGQCTFVEDFLTTFYGIENIAYNVEIQENMLQPGYFRLVNAFGEAYPYNDPGDWDDSQDWYLEIHAEDPDGVYMSVQETGMAWSYGMFTVGSLAGYYIERQGKTLEEMKAAGYTGTYKDGIITFPTKTMLVGMADYNNGGLYTANTNGAFKVVMPGVVLADYSVEVAYAGKYTNAAGEDAGVIANLNSVGADVDFVRLAVVPGTDTDYAYEAARSENVDVVDVDPSTAQALVPFTEAPEDGKYILVAISYSGKVAQEASYATFKYVSSGEAAETWTAQYVGNYTYTQFFGSEDEPAVDEGLVLYQSDKDANRWKIEHWGYDADFIFTFDQTTGEILVQDQETGYEYGSYGMVMVDDIVDYTGSQNYGYSYYENGAFHFNVVYYVSAGIFSYGEETFELTGYPTESSNTVRAHNLKARSNAKINVKMLRNLNVKPVIR